MVRSLLASFLPNKLQKMGFGEAFINVQLVCQRIFDMPFYYSREKNILVANPNLRSTWKMLIWTLTKWGILTLVLHSVYRGGKLFLNSNKNSPLMPEQVFVHVSIFAAGLFTLASIYTMERQPSDFTYVASQVFKLGKIHWRGWPSSERLPDIQELAGYGLASSCMSTIGFVCLYPLLRSYDPINYELNEVIPEVPRRLLASCIYGFLTFNSAIIGSLFLGVVLAACHVFEKETANNKRQSTGIDSENPENRLECMVQEILFYIFLWLDRFLGRKKSSATIQPLEDIVVVNPAPTVTMEHESVITEQFYRSLRRHRQLCLLMEGCNENVQVFIPTMAFVGILHCTTFTYTLLTMYNREEFRLLFPSIALFLVCINILVLFFCKHASLPLIYTEETIHFWKGVLKGKLERRLCNSMQPFGFTLGVFFHAKRETALQMNDIILNSTITLLLF
ncbi:unnamed protein product [Orchesella dallaii]|uniref:Odorant receptor n=1 Tax=Orchesella dallaii TaxID=48710 RepID=A0ABP1PZT9_9HEXA